MPRNVVQTTAALHDRGLVPTKQGTGNDLEANPVLLVWRRLIDTAVDEAKRVRFGEPTDSAILARWWIEVEDDPDVQAVEFRATFERACGFLGIDNVATERAKLLKDIDTSWKGAHLAYMAKRVELRSKAVMTTAGCQTALGKTFALLLVSQAELEETAGRHRPDPPQWKRKLDRVASPRR